MRLLRIFLIMFLFGFSSNSHSQTLPSVFLFLGGNRADSQEPALRQSCIAGAQIIYSWKQLEPRKGEYDFTKIAADLTLLNKLHKKLFIQLQDRSFSPDVFNVPDYIRNDPAYHGGVAMQYDHPGEGKPVSSGWVARIWDPAVRERFQLLIQALAGRFDGQIAGINLPETAIDVDETHPPENFTPDNYFFGELANLQALRQAFSKSIVLQYVNFFPGEWNDDHHFMDRLFTYANQHHIALGGPDLVPYKKTQMSNSYPFFHAYQNQLLIAIAVQEPDYTYDNPHTGHPYRFDEFYNFARNYLGATTLFWNIEEPFFTRELLPQLDSRHFMCSPA